MKKRIFMMVVAMLSMTATFAETEKEARIDNEENFDLSAYDMTVDMRKLGVTLGLTFDQMEMVANIHNSFNDEMQLASHSDEAERQENVDRAIARDLRYMSYILNKEQYRKYQLLLETTLKNRGLK